MPILDQLRSRITEEVGSRLGAANCDDSVYRQSVTREEIMEAIATAAEMRAGCDCGSLLMMAEMIRPAGRDQRD